MFWPAFSATSGSVARRNRGTEEPRNHGSGESPRIWHGRKCGLSREPVILVFWRVAPCGSLPVLPRMVRTAHYPHGPLSAWPTIRVAYCHCHCHCHCPRPRPRPLAPLHLGPHVPETQKWPGQTTRPPRDSERHRDSFTSHYSGDAISKLSPPHCHEETNEHDAETNEKVSVAEAGDRKIAAEDVRENDDH